MNEIWAGVRATEGDAGGVTDKDVKLAQAMEKAAS